MSDQNKSYIKKINLNYEDGESIAEFISYERQAAIHDLINENSFSINEDDIEGPYVIDIKISDNVLIVNINSIAGINGTANESEYSASKHALKGFYDSIEKEPNQNINFLNIFPLSSKFLY